MTVGPTLFLFRILFDFSNFIVGSEELEIVAPVDEVEACDELLGKLETEVSACQTSR